MDRSDIARLLRGNPGMCYLKNDGSVLYVLVSDALIGIAGPWNSRTEREINRFLKTFSKENIPGNPPLYINREDADEALILLLLRKNPELSYTSESGKYLYILIDNKVVRVTQPLDKSWKEMNTEEIDDYLKFLMQTHGVKKGNEFTDWYYLDNPASSWCGHVDRPRDI